MTDSAGTGERADVFAGVELGGTKVVCGVGTADGTLLARESVPTRDPEATLEDIRQILEAFADRFGPPRGLGVASFGPIRIDRSRADYGRIGPTPKLAWRGTNLREAFSARFDGPIEILTDVIGAAIGEARWGAGAGHDPLVYITVGTGIGGGVLVHGRPVTGLLHPEVGHMFVPRAPGDDYPGGCTGHGDCIEGLAAGPSILARWGARLDELEPGHEANDVIAHYLAHLVLNLVLCVAPRRIVMGGGVLSGGGILPRIRDRVRDLSGDFLAVDELADGIDGYIVPPGLGQDSGVLGAIAMAVDRAGP